MQRSKLLSESMSLLRILRRVKSARNASSQHHKSSGHGRGTAVRFIVGKRSCKNTQDLLVIAKMFMFIGCTLSSHQQHALQHGGRFLRIVRHVVVKVLQGNCLPQSAKHMVETGIHATQR